VTNPTIGVLALQGDFREHLAMLADLGATGVGVRRPEELERVDGLIIPGGESTVMDKLSRLFGLAEPLKQRIASGLPVYGTCAGLILLADTVRDSIEGQQSFGGLDVVVRRNAFGRQVDSFEAELDVTGFDEPFHAMFIRAPWVEKVGAEVSVVATVATGSAMGRIVAVRQGTLLATSFHPEITGDHRFHSLFVELVSQAGTSHER
jgi:pyridoxal 5'-phosphate synthase pdxT subunit